MNPQWIKPSHIYEGKKPDSTAPRVVISISNDEVTYLIPYSQIIRTVKLATFAQWAGKDITERLYRRDQRP